VKLAHANQIADEMTTAIMSDLGDRAAGDLLLFVNGFGGTPSVELYLIYNAARRWLEKHGLRIGRSLVGSFVTSLEMAGCSLTVSVLDDEMMALWDHPVHTASLRW
jgi:phosphoenolpyruvate---glycerone phosphotransferase subunit DhaK